MTVHGFGEEMDSSSPLSSQILMPNDVGLNNVDIDETNKPPPSFLAPQGFRGIKNT